MQTAGGKSATSSADQFFYGSPPTITGLSPQSGPVAGGTTITISGTGFTAATVVGFGGLPASSVEVKSDTEIQATTPPEPAGTVDIEVVTPAGANAQTQADQYTYFTTRSTGTSVSCTPGSVAVAQATTCTATVSDSAGGAQSTPGGAVSFTSSGAGSFSSSANCTLTSVSSGVASCQLSYTPTAVGSGTHTITASYGGDPAHTTSSSTMDMTVTPPPPQASISSPASGGTVCGGAVGGYELLVL